MRIDSYRPTARATDGVVRDHAGSLVRCVEAHHRAAYFLPGISDRARAQPYSPWSFQPPSATDTEAPSPTSDSTSLHSVRPGDSPRLTVLREGVAPPPNATVLSGVPAPLQVDTQLGPHTLGWSNTGPAKGVLLLVFQQQIRPRVAPVTFHPSAENPQLHSHSEMSAPQSMQRFGPGGVARMTLTAPSTASMNCSRWRSS